MHGVVEWPALIAITGTIVTVTLAVSAFACWLLWMAWTQLKVLRTEVQTEISTVKTALEGQIAGVSKQVEQRIEGVDHRLRKVEAEHVLGMATREDFKDFQKAIERRFDQLRNERRDDIRGLHSRLNDLLMIPRPSAIAAEPPSSAAAVAPPPPAETLEPSPPDDN
jgi:hypothetical protein